MNTWVQKWLGYFHSPRGIPATPNLKFPYTRHMYCTQMIRCFCVLIIVKRLCLVIIILASTIELQQHFVRALQDYKKPDGDQTDREEVMNIFGL